MVPDLFTDYLASIPEEDKEEWKANMVKWGPEFDLSSRVQYEMQVRPLTDADVDALVARMEEVGGFDQTVGKKTYIELEMLNGGATVYLYEEFTAYGNEMKNKINSTAADHPVDRLDGKDLLLLTWGDRMKGCPLHEARPKARQAKQEKHAGRKRRARQKQLRKARRRQQTAHIDVPARVVDLPDEVKAFQTGFLAMTKRSATQFYGALSLEKLLQGKKWSTSSKVDRKWILWRLQCAHMHAQKMQTKTNEIAEKNNEWESTPAGTVNIVDATKEWHAGQPPLQESLRPEVLLIFQFAWRKIAKYYNEHLNADGGFGQHPWTAEIAADMLKEVERDNRCLSQVVSGAAPVVAAAEFQGAGVSRITTDEGESYLIRVPEQFVHMTGPCLAPDTEVERVLCVIGGRFPGDPTTSEHDRLRKKSYMSHLYHYGYTNQAVARDAPVSERKSKYIEKDAQARAENLIDTESTAVPEIPHGPLSHENFERLKREARNLRRGVILFTGLEDEWEKETPENKRNLLEAHENLRKSRLLGKKPILINKHVKPDRDSSDADKPTIRAKWNTIARANLNDLNVADADDFEVESVHLVNDLAGRYHYDLLGLGQTVIVTALETNEPYYVLFAAVKQGDCPEEDLRLYGDDETAAVPPPGNVDAYICIAWS